MFLPFSCWFQQKITVCGFQIRFIHIFLNGRIGLMPLHYAYYICVWCHWASLRLKSLQYMHTTLACHVIWLLYSSTVWPSGFTCAAYSTVIHWLLLHCDTTTRPYLAVYSKKTFTLCVLSWCTYASHCTCSDEPRYQAPPKHLPPANIDDEEQPLGGSESDSMAEYEDTDPTKFNEDGSFIGTADLQYFKHHNLNTSLFECGCSALYRGTTPHGK